MSKKAKQNYKKMKDIFIPRMYYNDNNISDKSSEMELYTKYFINYDLLNRYSPSKPIGIDGPPHMFGCTVSQFGNQKYPELKVDSEITIKKVEKIFDTNNNAKRLLKELQILGNMKHHDNIVKLYDIIPQRNENEFDRVLLVYELLEGSLEILFKTNQFLTELHVQYVLCEILLGLKHMHSNGIIHCNLRPSNIFINGKCWIKICDFDSVCKIGDNIDFDYMDDIQNTYNNGMCFE